MSLAAFDRSASVGSRITWVVLLCAVALGIVGMHGLVGGADSSQSAGHHLTQSIALAPVIDLALEAATSHAASADAATADAASPVAGTHDTGPAEDDAPAHGAGLLALCLMVLAPAVTVALFLLARSRVGVRHVRRVLVRAGVAADVAVPKPPFRRLSVLRI